MTGDTWIVNSLQQLLDFVIQLQNDEIDFRLDCVRDAIMVVIPTPHKYYEIEFFADGHVESQTFGPSSPTMSVNLAEIAAAVKRTVDC